MYSTVTISLGFTPPILSNNSPTCSPCSSTVLAPSSSVHQHESTQLLPSGCPTIVQCSPACLPFTEIIGGPRNWDVAPSAWNTQAQHVVGSLESRNRAKSPE